MQWSIRILRYHTVFINSLCYGIRYIPVCSFPVTSVNYICIYSSHCYTFRTTHQLFHYSVIFLYFVDAIWRTDLDFMVVHRDRLVVLSFMTSPNHTNYLPTPLPFHTSSSAVPSSNFINVTENVTMVPSMSTAKSQALRSVQVRRNVCEGPVCEYSISLGRFKPSTNPLLLFWYYPLIHTFSYF
jgi:hypothetical protein